jgi:hypothetical protein
MGKPQVGISSMWYEGNPCNMHLLKLAEYVKEGVVSRAALRARGVCVRRAGGAHAKAAAAAGRAARLPCCGVPSPSTHPCLPPLHHPPRAGSKPRA